MWSCPARRSRHLLLSPHSSGLGSSANFAAGFFVAKSFALNQAGMRQLIAGFKRLGLAWIPSYANFVSVEIRRGHRAKAGESQAGAVFQRLLAQGVIVRPVAGYRMPDHLRVTVGLPEENTRFLAALENALAVAGRTG